MPKFKIVAEKSKIYKATITIDLVDGEQDAAEALAHQRIRAEEDEGPWSLVDSCSEVWLLSVVRVDLCQMIRVQA